MPTKKKTSSIYAKTRQRVFGSLFYPGRAFKKGSKKFEELHRNFYSKDQDTKVNLTFNVSSDDLLPKQVDAVMFTNDKQSLYDPEKTYVVVAGEGCYEQYDFSLQPFINENHVNVLAFNPMGVGNSTGATNGPEDYQEALRSIIDNLRGNGIASSNIILVGSEFGAGLAATVADEYQQRGDNVKLMLVKDDAKLNNIYGSYVPKVGGFIYRALAQLFGLNVNAKQAFKRINERAPGRAKIVPKAEINAHLGAELNERADDKVNLEAFRKTTEELVELSKEMLAEEEILIKSLQAKDVPVEDLHNHSGKISKLNAKLNEQYLRLRSLWKKLDILLDKMIARRLISTAQDDYTDELLKLSRQVLTLQENLETAVEIYGTTSRNLSVILDYGRKVQNITSHRNVSPESEQNMLANVKQELVTAKQDYNKKFAKIQAILDNADTAVSAVRKKLDL